MRVRTAHILTLRRSLTSIVALGHDKAQSIIDQITAAYESGAPPPGGFGFGPQHLAPPGPPFGGPPMGYGAPPFGGPPPFGGTSLQLSGTSSCLTAHRPSPDASRRNAAARNDGAPRCAPFPSEHASSWDGSSRNGAGRLPATG